MSDVSIHAPREGCDLFQSKRPVSLIGFQFTHPGRGATGGFFLSADMSDVSIHAPREGCDLFQSKRPVSLIGFQFTHPGRGATKKQ